jgi:hypothetical protein
MSDCGHGHVWPVAGGLKARCGGPAICSKCAIDAAAKAAGEVRYPPPAIGARLGIKVLRWLDTLSLDDEMGMLSQAVAIQRVLIPEGK